MVGTLRFAHPTNYVFHRYVERGVLVADWGGDIKDIPGSFGE
jgi:hypothetical protein